LGKNLDGLEARRGIEAPQAPRGLGFTPSPVGAESREGAVPENGAFWCILAE